MANAAGGAARAIESISPAIDRIALGFAGLGDAITVFRTLGQAVDSFLVKPLARIGEQFITATEASRKFELAVSGITGTGRARALNYGPVSASRGLPADVAALRTTGQTFAALPAIAGRLP